MPSRKWAWFWVGMGLLLFLIDIFDVFNFELFGFHFPIGVLATLYGVLILIYYRARDQALELTPDELSNYGPALEEAVPLIMDMLERKTAVRDIAQQVFRERGVPPEITYKYIIALGREIAQQDCDSSLEDTT